LYYKCINKNPFVANDGENGADALMDRKGIAASGLFVYFFDYRKK
jgi:hypothetical protein